MTIHIELKPEEERALLERARQSGRDTEQYVQELVRDHIQASPEVGARAQDFAGGTATLDDLIDHEFVADCARDTQGKDIPTIEEVRQMLSKIPGSLAEEIIAEREDRF
jgi:hypothetical protein